LAPAYNEAGKIGTVVSRIPRDIVDRVLVVDDGSTDNTQQESLDRGAEVMPLGTVRGVGFAIRQGLEWTLAQGMDVAVILAGNNKDSPEQIPRLLDPMVSEGADFVQGSRYLDGGESGNMPLYRQWATRLHPWLFSLCVGRRITDSTNGFRAIRLRFLKDERLHYREPWLDTYELEPYLFWSAIRLGYKVTEVPCTKIYPPRSLGYTKMRPLVDWWRILRPLFYLKLGIKH
jgi:dolichol-phosphate mannosyltransferase